MKQRLLCARPELGIGQGFQQKENVIVGIELTHFDPYVRDAKRDRLASDFGPQYCDPRSSARKVWIKPIDTHFYDILVVPQGTGCPGVTAAEIDEIANLMK